MATITLRLYVNAHLERDPHPAKLTRVHAENPAGKHQLAVALPGWQAVCVRFLRYGLHGGAWGAGRVGGGGSGGADCQEVVDVQRRVVHMTCGAAAAGAPAGPAALQLGVLSRCSLRQRRHEQV